MKTAKVGIIGVKGRFGRWFKWFFEKHGCDVWGADLNTASGPKDVVKWAQVVIVCVPLPVAPEIIRGGFEDSRNNQLWVDISAVKAPATNALFASNTEFVSIHPLFAPQEGLGWSKRKVVVVESRIDRWRDWWESFCKVTGACYVIEEALFHDTHMLGAQNGVHALALSHLDMCRDMGLDPKALLELSTPLSAKQLAIAARMLSNNPEVYADIQLCNPESARALDSMIDSLRALRKMVKNKDKAGIIERIKHLREYLGEEVIKEALKEFES